MSCDGSDIVFAISTPAISTRRGIQPLVVGLTVLLENLQQDLAAFVSFLASWPWLAQKRSARHSQKVQPLTETC